MAVDLRPGGLFEKKSVVLEADAVVVIKSGTARDSVRRYGYDRIEGVSLHQRPAWGTMGVAAALLLFPALLFFANDLAVVGIVLGAIAVAAMLYAAIVQRTELQVTRAGETARVVGLATKAQGEKLFDRLCRMTDRTQASAWAAYKAAHPPAVDVDDGPNEDGLIDLVEPGEVGEALDWDTLDDPSAL